MPHELLKKEPVSIYENPGLLASIKVLLVDDHQLVLKGLRAILERRGFTTIEEATDGTDAIRQTAQFQPDVVVLDIEMPEMNGIEAAREIAKNASEMKVIVVTMHTEDHYIAEALRAGVRGYVLKSRASSEVLDAIQEVVSGGTYLSPGISQHVVDAYLDRSGKGPTALTPRELQVLQLVAMGKTSKEIASLLGVSFKTADSHRTNIMHKLKVHSVADLVRYAIRRGLVSP